VRCGGFKNNIMKQYYIITIISLFGVMVAREGWLIKYTPITDTGELVVLLFFAVCFASALMMFILELIKFLR
jgi:hypothetical protein